MGDNEKIFEGNRIYNQEMKELVEEFFKNLGLNIDINLIKRVCDLLCFKKVLNDADINKWSAAIVQFVVDLYKLNIPQGAVSDYFVLTGRDVIEITMTLKNLIGSDFNDFKPDYNASNQEAMRIIPVASGKGGVGKSLVAASLAISLASKGFSTIAIDLDLGGSNMHNYLGIPNKNPGIGDYLKAGKSRFEDIIQKTRFKNLDFVAGDGKSPFMANIPFQQKNKLTKDIKKLDYNYIILDIGAGSSFNTLSYFNMSPKGVIVSGTESASIMNFLTFLKNLMFKVIASSAKNNLIITEMIKEAFRQPIERNAIYVSTLLNKIYTIDRNLHDKLINHLGKYRPRIIFNMIDSPEELRLLSELDMTLKKNLSLQCDFIGGIVFDNEVRRIVKSKNPVVMNNSHTKFYNCIDNISDRIIRVWDKPLKDSHKKLYDDVRKLF
ncbi:MAG: P-loop NTPase [Candidatus Delongbacteria bacterium]|nr:P-loop NTPase [Candidatus Delongbacteria bacterium]MBN2836519.1 P-loop NTPase [Candidatus Delongbacteria bacterium]